MLYDSFSATVYQLSWSEDRLIYTAVHVRCSIIIFSAENAVTFGRTRKNENAETIYTAENENCLNR